MIVIEVTTPSVSTAVPVAVVAPGPMVTMGGEVYPAPPLLAPMVIAVTTPFAETVAEAPAWRLSNRFLTPLLISY